MRFLLDEDFHGDVLRGVLRIYPDLDYIRVQDVTDLSGKSDAEVLAWAASDDRIVLSRDFRTLRPAAYRQIEANLPMPGVFICPRSLSIGETIQELVLIIGASEPDEYRDKVLFLPLE